MIQNVSFYQVEKMIRFQHEEMNKKMRAGLFIKQIAAERQTFIRQAGDLQTLWRKWFKKRRLDTSWK